MWVVRETVTSLDRCTDDAGVKVAKSLSRLWTETMQRDRSMDGDCAGCPR